MIWLSYTMNSLLWKAPCSIHTWLADATGRVLVRGPDTDTGETTEFYWDAVKNYRRKRQK